MLARMDNPEMAQLQGLLGDAHGFRSLGCFIKFKFDPVAMSAMKKKEIEFNPAVGCPKERLRRFEDLKGMLKRETFPGGTDPGMADQRVKIWNIEQAVENPGVPKVYLRRFHLAFSDILMPRLKLPHHKGPGQDIEIRTHGFIGNSHGPTQLGGVPGLSVIVSQHGPETAQGRRGNRNAGRQVRNDMIRNSILVGKKEGHK